MAGILHVTIEPRPGLNPARFHEWYNNEHGPIRLRIPHVFRNGTRYRAADGQAPSFVAIYDVADVALLETDVYTCLRENRSPREAIVIGQTEVRRGFYQLVEEVGDDAPVDVDVNVEGTLTAAVEVRFLREGEVGEWFGDVTARLGKELAGGRWRWLRSRVFRHIGPDHDAQQDPTYPYLVLHDFCKADGSGKENDDLLDPLGRIGTDERYVAAERRRSWSAFYRFGPAPRDLASLSLLGPEHAFSSPDGRTSTTPGPHPVIESYITAGDALALPYRLEGNPAPDAPVVVFCNSLLTSLHMWDPLVAILKQARPGFKILRYDARGRHAVHRPATLQDVTSDLLALLDALRINTVRVLVGVSMGGVTAVNFALKHPTRLDSFIACDFNPTSSPENMKAWKDRIALAEDGAGGKRRLAERTVARWFHPDASRRDAGLVNRMEDMVAQNDLDGFKNSCTVLWDYDLRPLARGGCEKPGLLVAGSHDANGAIARAMEGFAGVVFRGGEGVRIVPETGHLPMVEDAAAFWATIQDFV